MSRVEWIPVASLDDIEMNKVLPYVVNDLSLVIVRTKETLAAFVDVCSHQTVKLSEFGEIQQGVLICHAHGAAFNCSTGEQLCFPARSPLRQILLKIEDSKVYICPQSIQPGFSVTP